MKEVLEPLGRVPGVRMALLVSPDGVPVVVRGRGADDPEREVDLSGESAESLAALAAGWLHGLSRSVAPLSWSAPQSVVLRAARGTLLMLHAPGSVLLVLLDVGTQPEELRLPMEGAVARIQRVLRTQRTQRGGEPPSGDGSFGGPLPNRTRGQDPRFYPTDTSRTDSPLDLPG